MKNCLNSLENLESQLLFLLDFPKKSPFCFFSCIKNGLRSCMVTKVGALESCDLGAPLRYLKHAPYTSRNFLEVYKVKVVTQKLFKFNRKFRVLTLNFGWISQKSVFCYFSCIKNGLRSRMVTEVGALDRCDLRASLKYLE